MQLLERDDHLATLGARLAEVRGRRRGQLVLLAGEAGVGKTALVRAFADAHPSVPALTGACEALFTPRPLGPLLDIGGELAELTERGASAGVVLTALARALRGASIVVLEDLHCSRPAGSRSAGPGDRHLPRRRAGARPPAARGARPADRDRPDESRPAVNGRRRTAGRATRQARRSPPAPTPPVTAVSASSTPRWTRSATTGTAAPAVARGSRRSICWPSGRGTRPRRISPRSALRTWRRWACA
jgi:hypothetical protein